MQANSWQKRNQFDLNGGQGFHDWASTRCTHYGYHTLLLGVLKP
jgi:hypothetical protein